MSGGRQGRAFATLVSAGGVLAILVTPAGASGAVAGGKIVFYSDRDGHFEIYVMNPNGADSGG